LVQLLAARQAFFDAQRRHPHDAVVFVGNLPSDWTDLALLHSTKDKFGRFGRCEVMIRRGKGPYAIVQYQVCLH
jgi:hypothetical protein